MYYILIFSIFFTNSLAQVIIFEEPKLSPIENFNKPEVFISYNRHITLSIAIYYDLILIE